MKSDHVQYSSVNSHHRYTRPFINYHETLNDAAAKLLRKRFPKFIHKISLPEDQKVIPSLNHIKLLHTFEVSRLDSDELRYRRMYREWEVPSQELAPIKSASQFLKLLKPMKNQIKRLKLEKFTSLTRYFPFLKTFDLIMDDVEQWRAFLFCCRLESLNIFEIPQHLEKNKIEDIITATECIKKYGLRLVQRMIDRQSVKHLRISLTAKFEKTNEKPFRALVNCCLVLFTKMIPYVASSSIKTFTFEDRNSLLLGPQYRTKHPKDVLQYATDLHIPGCFWSPCELYSYVSFDNLKNLVDLKLSFSEKDSDLSGFSGLSVLPNLKKISFSFERCEEIFLRYFTLPKTVISVHLKLEDFSWKKKKNRIEMNKKTYEDVIVNFKNDPLCTTFFSRWSGLDQLKELKVEIYDYIENIELPAGFVMLLAQELSSLETFIYKQHPKGSKHRYYYYAYLYNDEPDEGSSVNIDNFLKKLQQSKSSLQKLHIQASRLSFYNPQNITAEMPQLKSFTVCGNKAVYGGQNFLKTCKNSPITQAQTVPLVLNLSKFLLEDNQTLIEFLDVLCQVPETLDLTLSVYITRVNPEILVKHLCRFLAKSKMRGPLCIMLEKYCLCSWENLNKIKTAALKNSSLGLFQIKSEIEVDTMYRRKKSIYILEARRGILTRSCDPEMKLA